MLPAREGARGVIRNADEQSALLLPLLSLRRVGSAQSACTNDADRRSSAGAHQSAGGRLPGAKIGVRALRTALVATPGRVLAEVGVEVPVLVTRGTASQRLACHMRVRISVGRLPRSRLSSSRHRV
jgi:hypothetical protein